MTRSIARLSVRAELLVQ